MLLVVIILVGGVALIGSQIQKNKLAALRSNSAPGAGVLPGDSLPEINAKVHNYEKVEEAVRIFHDVLHQDEILPILSADTRKEMKEYLSDHYKKKH